MNDKIEKTVNSSLATRSEEEIVAGYLIQLRKILQEDVVLIGKVSACEPAIDAKPHLIAAIEANPDTEHLLDKAAVQLLKELENQRKSKPSLYLVSNKTGKAVMPINENHVFTPPQFVGLDGKLHDSRPVVHPGITSSIAVAAHEMAKEEALAAISGNELAFAHMSDPDKVLELTRQKLDGIVSFEDLNGSWEQIELGKENAAGMEQSANRSFHRIELFSSILARRIVDRCGKGGRCQLGGMIVNRGAKHRWYVVSVKFERADVSGADQKFGQN